MRCAIYTRKSSEEGLSQDFNSLDAQREACEAFIASQKQEGWTVVGDHYDDGGISGGTMERPALKRLLEDIAAGKIDSVVVYKVDRLSRSLSDFVILVEVFDDRNISFVSVTQQFNTTTSMGRLTLNMLLSFAQFEREVTGERIRDKIAASKRKGMWMGGLPPLGYDVKERHLVINQVEADTVNDIYRRYLLLGSVRLLMEDLDRDGIVSKRRVNKHGRTTGNKPFARGALYLMLSNRLYLGKIVHKDKCYPGEHEPIISTDLWNDVQSLLDSNRVNRKAGANADNPSLLAGMLFDENGERMTPSHARKKGKAYRYYISRTLTAGSNDPLAKGRRLPAGDIEGLVECYIMQLLKGAAELHEMMEAHIQNVLERQSLIVAASQLASRWPHLSTSTKRQILNNLIVRINIGSDRVNVQIRPQRLPGILGEKDCHSQINDSGTADTLKISIPAKLKRTGLEARLVVEGNNDLVKNGLDPHLVRLIGRAQDFQTIFLRGGKSIAEMASEAGVSGSYFTRTLRLSFLAPDIIKAISEGTHPVQLTSRRLKSFSRIPMLWCEQRSMLDFA